MCLVINSWEKSIINWSSPQSREENVSNYILYQMLKNEGQSFWENFFSTYKSKSFDYNVIYRNKISKFHDDDDYGDDDDDDYKDNG